MRQVGNELVQLFGTSTFENCVRQSSDLCDTTECWRLEAVTRELSTAMGDSETSRRIKEEIAKSQRRARASGIRIDRLKELCESVSEDLSARSRSRWTIASILFWVAAVAVFIVAIAIRFFDPFENLSAVRCLLPNNYLIWEATRPISDCAFCEGVSKPIVLRNITKKQFEKYAYSSGPIIVKGAVSHWKAMEKFDYDMFKNLYEHTDGAYESVEEGCQFLNFKSDLFTLREVFSMSDKRANYEVGEEPWYVGWGNCHPDILAEIRKYYTYPEFLPDDSELPNTENIFFGYEQGAVMHLDYIPRLMWQGQIKGNKTWNLAPIPECDHVCKPFTFYVEPGDAVLLDTRIWYHATYIPSGQFSLTVQSEYG